MQRLGRYGLTGAIALIYGGTAVVVAVVAVWVNAALS